jgi:hypothetical protein
LPESPCNKYLISAHRQSSLSRFPRRPVGQFGGVQKTDVCCTGLDIQLRRSIQSLAMSLKCSLFSVSYGPLGAHLLNGAAAPLAAVDGFDGTPSRTIPRSVLRRDRPFNRLSARPQVQRLQQSRLVISPCSSDFIRRTLCATNQCFLHTASPVFRCCAVVPPENLDVCRKQKFSAQAPADLRPLRAANDTGRFYAHPLLLL